MLTILRLMIFFLLSTSLHAATSGIPVLIRWDKRLPLAPAFLAIEIGQDPSYHRPPTFSSVLFQQEGFYWTAPREGVFHYRIGHKHDRNLIHGSFVVLKAAGTESVATVTWEPIKGATGYQLRLTKSGSEGQIYNVLGTEARIARERLPLLVEIFPKNSPVHHKSFKTYNYGLSLHSDSEGTSKKWAGHPAPMRWRISVGGVLSRETSTTSQTPIFANNRADHSGGRLVAEGPIIAGFHMFGLASRTGSRHEIAESASAGLRPPIPNITSERNHWQLMLGYDILHYLGTRHHLNILAGGGATEIIKDPMSRTSAVLSLSGTGTISTQIHGVGAQYTYMGNHEWLSAHISGFKGTHESLSSRAELTYGVQVLGPVTIEATLGQAKTRLEFCDHLLHDCQGAIKASVTDSYGSVGLGLRL